MEGERAKRIRHCRNIMVVAAKNEGYPTEMVAAIIGITGAQVNRIFAAAHEEMPRP